MAKVIFSHETTPSPAPAGTMIVYSKADRVVYSMDDLGNEIPLTRGNLGTLAFQNATNASIGGISSVDLSGGSLTLANDQLLWSWLSKVGSSLADIELNQHSLLDDDEPEKHREINDAGVSLTSLWSSQKISDELASIGYSLTPYIVGKGASDPYSTIQSAIDQAVTDGATFTNPAVVIVKPGVYVEDVSVAVGVSVWALTLEKSYMTRVTGTLTFNSGAGGSVGSKITAWIGIDVSGDGTNPTLQFSGLNPQRLNLLNCEINSPGPSPACVLSNTGSGSVLVADDANFNQSGSGLQAAEAILANAGKVSLTKVQANAFNHLDAISLINASQIEGFFVYTTGRVVLGNTAGGMLSNLVANAGATEAVVMGSTGSLLLANSISLGYTKLAGGANPSLVIEWPRAKTVPFDNSAIAYSAVDVQAAIEEMEKKEDTIPYFEGSNPPDFVNFDDYNFDDGAALAAGSDQDVIFRVVPPRKYQTQGLRLLFRYCMSVANTGTVRLRLDYRVKKTGDPATGGTDYVELVTVDPVDLAQELDVYSGLTIPSGRITLDTEFLYCRLTRLGTDVLDTHLGDFCLGGIGVIGL
jgi:hypothetical protein